MQHTVPTHHVHSSVQLSSAHLIELEPELCRVLGGIIPFNAHSLHFPTASIPQSPRWIAAERSLILPLCHQGETLGVFIAKGVNGHTVRRLMPQLPAIVSLCLDTIALLRITRIDASTNLAQPHVLLNRMCNDIDEVRSYLHHGETRHALTEDFADVTPPETLPKALPDKKKRLPESPPLYRACAGLITIFWHNKDAITQEHGYAFTDALLHAMGDNLHTLLGDTAIPARIDDATFAVLLPAATPAACHNTALKALQCLTQTTLRHQDFPLVVTPECTAGYALYPQDIDAYSLRHPTSEQARILLDKARLAAKLAYARHRNNRPVEERILGFGQILIGGGIIEKVLPMGRIVTSLGAHVSAAEGQRFAVYSTQTPPRYKGEIVLQHVQATTANAETLHIADIAYPPAVGDSLHLIPATSPLHGNVTTSQQQNSLLAHGDFLHALQKETARSPQFSLILIRLAYTAPDTDNAHDVLAHIAQLYTDCSQRLHNSSPRLMGRYGENSLVLLLPTKDIPEKCLAELCNSAQNEQYDIAVGTASYPYLQFHKDEILECCHKALELALLLPAPRVGTFGSLALTISADKRYAQGDVFGALDEYKLALLADADNTLAWNSLGACMAALARHGEARRHFLQALKRAPKDPTTLYNLGNVCQHLNSTRAAASYYRKCIACAPEHYFAHIRLGQLAEKSGRTRQAHASYSFAASLEDAAQQQPKPQDAKTTTVRNSITMPQPEHYVPTGSGMARRHLARLALRKRKQGEARELLHEVLLRNPQDTAAMHMLAEIYLDSNEDPGVAQMLARKCVALAPDSNTYKALLQRALHAEKTTKKKRQHKTSQKTT